MTTATPILSIKGISKSFPGVKALAGVDFTLKRGEVHALMGENGAGKSTLIKLLTGVYIKDQGQILLEGKEINPLSPNQAQEIGISTVYQEVNLIPTLSVAENIFLGRQPMNFGFIDWEKMKSGAEAALKRLNLYLDVKQQLSTFSIAIQQMVAIARALDFSAKILILDEPTSSLDKNEVEQLFTVIKKLKNEGLGIIFVTHFLDQVYEISDRITVLRNGKLVGDFETVSLPKVELIAKMMGKELVEIDSTTAKNESGKKIEKAPFISIKGLSKKGNIEPFDMNLYHGEVLGFAGLLGSGRTEIARLLFGIDKADNGQIMINNKKVIMSSPKKAIECGFGFCPEDRKTSGIIEELTVKENIILALQASKGWFRPLSRKAQEEIANNYIRALNIATPNANQKIKHLSGGNQQKAIVGRWLASNPELLILDEPTRGIDVGAKTEIQKLILSLSQEGMSILFISSELSEVVRCSHRVAVLRDRVKIDELTGKQIDEHVIMHTIAEG
jgi:ABC-type sugar transport system, ATPase component